METEIKKVYICKVKLIGSQFAVLDKQLAESWINLDPESNYYETLDIEYEL